MASAQDLEAIEGRFAEIGSRMGLSAAQAEECLAAFQRISKRYRKKQLRGLRYGYRRLRAMRHGLPKCRRDNYCWPLGALFT